MTAITQSVSNTQQTIQLRLLGFSTCDFLQQALRPAFSAADYEAAVSSAGFGTVVAELLQPASEIPDAVIIQVDACGIVKRDWRQSNDDAAGRFGESIDVFLGALEGFANTQNAQILINSLPSLVSPSVGFLDMFHSDGEACLTGYFNRRLGELAQRLNNITIIDTDMAMAQIAPAKRSDPKLWFYGRIPYSTEGTQALAAAFAQAFKARKSKPVKVLALDLDNTLWRGIFGEDGISGIECGDDFPGNAFKAFQEECLRLKGQGLLLTILSKNDEDVLQVFDDHPGMALRLDDFVAHRINWEPKGQNVRSLAEELDLGLDSFVFLDDSPHEREGMRQLSPEVRVPELPDDPAVRIDFLRNYVPLWPLRLTAEDRSRSELYVVQSKGRTLKSQVANLDDYLASLGQSLCVEAVTPATLPRVAQMHARTNQFNLTTRRFSEADLAAMMADPGGHQVVLGRLKDRFGDHGIVTCACISTSETRAGILTFLMSCRVIGRKVEHAFLGALIEMLVARGIDAVEAGFIPTQKNTPARGFYEEAGFTPLSSNASESNAEIKWVWNKDTHALPGSQFISTETKD